MSTSKKVDTIDNIEKIYVAKDTPLEYSEEVGYALSDSLRSTMLREIYRACLNDTSSQCGEKEIYIPNCDLSSFYPNVEHYLMDYVKASNKGKCLEDDIKALKKRIKHAKSPLEQKALQKQLNEAYKKAKRKKHE
jgi:hypothetical protein